MHYDVAIIGGGPGGSTTASYLRKYGDDVKVLILEREKFPRDHVGESQLPPISLILQELGVWDKIEAANFPIKIGASYRWGKTPELWHFEFFPRKEFQDEPRPAKFEGQRKWTAFQVDRAIYDDILLRHSEQMGTEVREETKVTQVLREGDRVEGLMLDSGEVVTADLYVDASGHSGILRRAMGVETKVPTALQNIAIWEYWQNTEWAETVGTGGTMVQVLSIGYGWFWFIPLGPTRTSIGFITSAQYYKESGLTPEELYRKAMSEEETILDLTKNATREGQIFTTKDWSFTSDRLVGENWMLVGESAGFADPILAAGLSLTHVAGREAAFTILARMREEHDWAWLGSEYQRRQLRRVENHIRFADYWYSANAQFKDLQGFTQEIARVNGLDLSPEKAWAWLAQGGFINDELSAGIGGYSVAQIREISDRLSDLTMTSVVKDSNIFRLDLIGCKQENRAVYADGKITSRPCYVRGEKTLVQVGAADLIVHVLAADINRVTINQTLRAITQRHANDEAFFQLVLSQFEVTLEAMIQDGWVKTYYEPSISMEAFPSSDNLAEWLNQTAVP